MKFKYKYFDMKQLKQSKQVQKSVQKLNTSTAVVTQDNNTLGDMDNTNIQDVFDGNQM